jgi:hypothetical protein
VRLPEQAEKSWHPFDVTLHFPEEAVRAASGSTWTRTFKMRAASDPESTLLLEASCQFPASDAAQRRVARTAIEVREALRERFGKIPNDSPGAAATAGKGQATGREPTASSSSSSDCELEETYQEWNDTCDCWVSVYECKDGGDDDGSDTCDKNISTRAGAGDACHDSGGGDGDGGGGGGGDEPVASYCGSDVSTYRCEQIGNAIEILENHSNGDCKDLGANARSKFFDGGFVYNTEDGVQQSDGMYSDYTTGTTKFSSNPETGQYEPAFDTGITEYGFDLAAGDIRYLASAVAHEEVHHTGVDSESGTWRTGTPNSSGAFCGGI